MRVPTRKSEEDRRALQDEPDRHLTPAAIERLKRQLADAERAIPAAKAELQRAQEMGDLSENFGYQEAKAQLRRLNARVITLADRIAQAVPITAGTADGTVTIGSTVTVETNERRFTFEILGSLETDPGRGRISHRSPLGAALLGKQEGDELTVPANDRNITYRVMDVR